VRIETGVLSAAAVLVSLRGGVCQAGVTIVLARAAGVTTTLTIEGRQARIDHPDRGAGGHTATIFDATTQKIVQLYGHERTYVELGPPPAAGKGDAVMEVRFRRKGPAMHLTPDEQRYVKDASEPVPGQDRPQGRDAGRFEPLPARKTISGFACRMYRRVVAGKIREETCVAPWGVATVQKSELAPFHSFNAARLDDMGDPGGPYDNQITELEGYPGLPIWRTIVYRNGERGRDERITSITRRPVPPSLFSPPQGYLPNPDFASPPAPVPPK
jgi:hypothetical protein